jgi:hypothetical protein
MERRKTLRAGCGYLSRAPSQGWRALTMAWHAIEHDLLNVLAVAKYLLNDLAVAKYLLNVLAVA